MQYAQRPIRGVDRCADIDRIYAFFIVNILQKCYNHKMSEIMSVSKRKG